MTMTPAMDVESGVRSLTAERSARSESHAQPVHQRAQRTLESAVAALMAKLRSERFHDRPGDAAGRGEGELLHWCAELEGDSILSSEYLLMKLILGQEGDRQPTERGGANYLQRIVNHLRLVQREDGTWGQYPGSPPDISACVKSYLALKAFGEDAEAPHMVRAREAILRLGGAERCNTFSTFYLACLGCVDWDACPAIPPEIVLFPRWFPFHMDKVAAWTRTMILPLAMCCALRPVRRLVDTQGGEIDINELFVDLKYTRRLSKEIDRDDPATWKNFFLLCDRVLKFVQRNGLSPLRTRSIREAERWIVERVDPKTTEGLGAIFPPMVYLQIAFKALGYPREHPLIQRAEKDLDDFIVVHDHADPKLDHVRLQPCFSPVWDTGIALYALTEAGLTAANDGCVARVCDWLVARQVRRPGDWGRNLRPEDRGIELGRDASAWAFEYLNDWYPDVDDTAMIAKAMWRAAGDVEAVVADRSDGEGSDRLRRYRQTAASAARWVFAMQNDDGGWAAFDRTRHREWMEAVPFADHNAMQDPSCADITGRTIESLVTCGVSPDHPRIRLAVEYLLSKQEPEGCWWGRWGVNYVYGTWQAMGGLVYAGFAPDHPALARATSWIKSVQNEDGGFGESANSYLDRSLMGKGPSTASQTAWGLACLLYTCRHDDPSCIAAVRWLCDHQLAADKPAFAKSRCAGPEAEVPGSDDLAGTDFQADVAGGWHEHHFTGTGFPKVFYLRYNLYRHYFPVMSLARWVKLAQRGG
ncbi:MAG: squalene--hopene cyclase [Phycisphaeraceae bacterium]|nr:squalene--hopene cyclase [Phycisphaeraceae bacterium]